ncbi:TPA: hypothetical protein ACUNF5_007469 [Burkholderia orbicola]|uniref:hypothetical protein n=1 Tax=Burkholderia orbicola TaxID=2978683 RepID=UPI00264D6815|nr:hypothetical protein [Burkholderia orbicola]MDN7535485.1 hypothetical protein [Burkholderia orbicola]
MHAKKLVVCGCIAAMALMAGCGGDDNGPVAKLGKIADVTPKKPVSPLPIPPAPIKPIPPQKPGKPSAPPDAPYAWYDLYGMGTPFGSSNELADASFAPYGGWAIFDKVAPSGGTFSIVESAGFFIASDTKDPRINLLADGVVTSADASGSLIGVCSADTQGYKAALPAFVGILDAENEWGSTLKVASPVDADTALDTINRHWQEGVEVVGCASPTRLAWSKPPLAPGESATLDDGDLTTWPVRVVLSSYVGAADTGVNYPSQGGMTTGVTGADNKTPWLSPENLRKALGGEAVQSTTGAAVTATAYILGSDFYVFLTRGAEKGQAATTYALRYPAS